VRTPRRFRTAIRRALCAALVAAYLAATLGVIPSPAAVSRWLALSAPAAERYPCENCGCGCATGRECWTHCCCHSEHERLVWALTNGVLPPRYVRFSDEQWLAAARRAAPGSAHCSLCVASLKERLALGEHIGTAPTDPDDCRQCAAQSTMHGDASASAEASTRPAPGAACISAMSCKGLAQLLLVQLPPTPRPDLLTLLPPLESPAPLPHSADETAASRALDTDSPPPRGSARSFTS